MPLAANSDSTNYEVIIVQFSPSSLDQNTSIPFSTILKYPQSLAEVPNLWQEKGGRTQLIIKIKKP
jgi:hypothetical protein